ncbi:family 43 glycosylhydrolase [Prauserella flavalba]|uniref:Beta-xylosidase n=1 Tax=Prauserella flavalba TaxID=1477506 RepID=A0A318LHX3_9PSEU|nr:family 43 glycosylhydrolase [Prauserella flavalba]PXY29590.1 beta-xylosidase [Prauserella flavalba]
MRTRHRRARLAGAALAVTVSAALVAGCTAGTTRPQAEGAEPGIGTGPGRPTTTEEQVPLQADRYRASPGMVAAGGADAVYNYGPTVMSDGGRTRMWWCSQYGSAAPPGDDILYAEANSPDGPFAGLAGERGIPEAVLSGNPGAFDGVHTCDPSVIRVDGTYYMYYTGAAGSHELGNSIGLVTSADGRHWTRPGTDPIVRPAHDTHRDNTYGAGQPAAVYLDGWFYLMFTDTTGRAAGWNGAGQFLLRAKDPTFSAGVQALGPQGFTEVPHTETARTNSLVDAFSADLMWVDALDAFAIAHQTDKGTTITFWNREFTATPYQPVTIPDEWEEGPGLLRRPDGHAPVSVDDPCGRVPIDVIHATVIGRAKAPTDLRHYGLDLHGLDACAEPERALAVLDGFAMPSPVRTMDLVTDGKVVRVDRRSVAEKLAGVVLDERLPVLDRLPVDVRLRPGARAVEAPGLGAGFLLDGTLWPVTSAEVVELNGSPAEPVSREEWEDYPAGPILGLRG